MSAKLTIRATICHPSGDVIVTEKGRRAWALLHLINAGAKGCTPIDNPGPRWSGYVHRLRGNGFAIETINEDHAGSFSGHHARYRLHSDVSVSGGNLAEWLASPEGRREFPRHDFFTRTAA